MNGNISRIVKGREKWALSLPSSSGKNNFKL